MSTGVNRNSNSSALLSVGSFFAGIWFVSKSLDDEYEYELAAFLYTLFTAKTFLAGIPSINSKSVVALNPLTSQSKRHLFLLSQQVNVQNQLYHKKIHVANLLYNH